MKCVYSQGSPKDKRTPADWAEGVERENHHKEHQLPPGHRNNPQLTPKPSTSNAMARTKRGKERGRTGVQENPTELREELLTILNQLGTQKLDILVNRIRRLTIFSPSVSIFSTLPNSTSAWRSSSKRRWVRPTPLKIVHNYARFSR